MISKINISPIIVFILFYCMLASAHACVTFGYSFWVEFAAAVVCYAYFSTKNAFHSSNATIWASILFFIAAAYTIRGGNLFGYIGKFLTVSLALVLINLKFEWRIELLKVISKWFAILLTISIVAWLLHFIVPLPHSTTVSDSVWGYSETVHNYFFFKETVLSSDVLLQRFQSVFLEPGHFGTIVTFFLIANRFDFKKKENVVFLVCALLSLSASAYVLLALGYLLYRFSESGNRKFVVSAIIVAGFTAFITYYNGGDNVVNDLIFGKLTREEGAIQSRVSLDVLAAYENMWRTGENLLLGKGIFGDEETLGAGFILFFVQHGLIGTILLALAYFSVFKSCRSRYGFIVFLIYIVSFIQRTYPFWDAFFMPYILGLPYFFTNKAKRNY